MPNTLDAAGGGHPAAVPLYGTMAPGGPTSSPLGRWTRWQGQGRKVAQIPARRAGHLSVHEIGLLHQRALDRPEVQRSSHVDH